MKKVKIDKFVAVIRAKLGAERITQRDLSKRTGIQWEHLNGFLCRRINLVDEDIEKLIDELDLEKFCKILSGPAELGIDGIIGEIVKE